VNEAEGYPEGIRLRRTTEGSRNHGFFGALQVALGVARRVRDFLPLQIHLERGG
jgi:hypothetical protein